MSQSTDNTAAATTTTTDATTVKAPAPAIGEQYETLQQLIKDVDEIVTRDRALAKQLKQLSQSYTREIKSLTKKNGRRTIAKSGKASKRAVRENMEVPAQTKLLSFLGKPADAKVSIADVRKFIGEYVRKNNLRDESKKRKIVPDANLRGVLGEPRYVFEKGELGYSYLNLPSYISDLLTFPAEVTPASGQA